MTCTTLYDRIGDAAAYAALLLLVAATLRGRARRAVAIGATALACTLVCRPAASQHKSVKNDRLTLSPTPGKPIPLHIGAQVKFTTGPDRSRELRVITAQYGCVKVTCKRTCRAPTTGQMVPVSEIIALGGGDDDCRTDCDNHVEHVTVRIAAETGLLLRNIRPVLRFVFHNGSRKPIERLTLADDQLVFVAPEVGQIEAVKLDYNPPDLDPATQSPTATSDDQAVASGATDKWEAACSQYKDDKGGTGYKVNPNDVKVVEVQRPTPPAELLLEITDTY